MNRFISKSKYLLGIQCHKLLWLAFNRPELIPAPSQSQQRIFDQGTEIGELARQRFPGGFLIEADHTQIPEAISQTQQAIENGREIIFEGAFNNDGIFARPDVIQRQANGRWNIIEVKSSTTVKEENIHDVAVQSYATLNSGIVIDKKFLMHINNECAYPNLSNLFAIEDITEEVDSLMNIIPENIAEMRNVLNCSDEPQILIGQHCEKPYKCPCQDYCWKWVPEYSIFQIPGLRWDKKQLLLSEGNVDISHLPKNFSLNENQSNFVNSVLTRETKIDWNSIKELLSSLNYPLHFFDFETDNPAVPRFDGMHPYEKFPFQFSCHILDEEGRVEHREYLHESETDPCESILESLLEAIKDKGSVIVYNAPFEKSVLNSLAEWFPGKKVRIMNIIDRLFDQLVIFRNYYTDYRFKGSNSIKSVLPVLIPSMNYQDLAVSDGTIAQITWNNMIRLPGGEQKSRLSQELKTYCGQDTLAMVKIHKFLLNGVNKFKN